MKDIKSGVQVENDLQNLYNEFLKKAGAIAFYDIVRDIILINRSVDEKRELFEKLEKEGENVLDYFEKINDKALNIEIILGLSDIEDKLGEEYFRNFKDKIVDLIRCLDSYATEMSYSLEIASQLLGKELVKENNDYMDKAVNFERLYSDVFEFLMEDGITFQEKLNEIIRLVPFRMSKHKFYDIVRTSLLNYLNDFSEREVNDYIEELKNTFNGSLRLQYGKSFDYYFTKTQGYKKFDFKTANLNEIEKLKDEISKLLLEIYDLMEMLSSLGTIVSKFIVIEKTKKYLTEDLNREDITEIIKRFKEVMKDENLEKRQELLLICEEKVNYIIASLDKLIKLIDDKEKELKNDESKDYLNNFYIEMIEIVSYLKDLGYEEIKPLSESDLKIVSDDYLEQAVDNFIQYIDRNLKDMTNIYRKVRMRRILSTLNGQFNSPEEFFEYLENSLKLNTSEEDLQLALYNIAELIISYEQNKPKKDSN
ncbi:hypothetical protein SAMN02745135_01489 [Caloranaerobacter azorensis DSM 13643]|uniref:Uncharacterized protein n=1 Tax=Caloranaerobacter azorensis DSM 13643 TaxID=1121264 RepID=A0A1M5UM57_9FIRM|nr:hypothetical protein [Caloranaerobacter azorensis]SHH64095.1 hypothetical protein SAMN02745135_01489 [Caloranaerobacter azorensis DSM 13643]